MIGELRGRELAVVAAVVGAGLSGTLVALGGRGGDAQFLQQQRNPPALQPAAVERVVRTAPDPLTGRGAGDSARCAKTGSGQLGNPWRCAVSYPSGRRVQIVVRIQQDGSYFGRYEGGGAASGCCVDLPGSG